MESQLFFEGTVEPASLDRATDARCRSRMGIFGTSLDYAGTTGSVYSAALGAELNPAAADTGGSQDGTVRPVIAIGPGEHDPWADLPPGCPRPMIAIGPGEEDPWKDLPPWSERPMGTSPNIAVGPGERSPWEDLPPDIPHPMSSSPVVYIPPGEHDPWADLPPGVARPTGAAPVIMPDPNKPGPGLDLPPDIDQPPLFEPPGQHVPMSAGLADMGFRDMYMDDPDPSTLPGMQESADRERESMQFRLLMMGRMYLAPREPADAEAPPDYDKSKIMGGAGLPAGGSSGGGGGGLLGRAWRWLTNAGRSVVRTVSRVARRVGGAVQRVVDRVGGAVVGRERWDRFKSGVKQGWDGLKSGVNSAWNNSFGKAVGIVVFAGVAIALAAFVPVSFMGAVIVFGVAALAGAAANLLFGGLDNALGGNIGSYIDRDPAWSIGLEFGRSVYLGAAALAIAAWAAVSAGAFIVNTLRYGIPQLRVFHPKWALNPRWKWVNAGKVGRWEAHVKDLNWKRLMEDTVSHLKHVLPHWPQYPWI